MMRRLSWALFGMIVAVATGRGADAPTTPATPAPAPTKVTTTATTDVTVSTRDTLVFKDGDRVQGKLVEKTSDTIVFKADRFGTIHVPAADAVIVPGEKPIVKAGEEKAAGKGTKSGKSAAKTPAEREEEEKLKRWEWLSPAQLTADVRRFFGPLHGKLAAATEILTDTSTRHDYSLDARLQRKWAHDDVQLNGHYDFAEADKVTTTDVAKAAGSWRHDFSKLFFSQYAPTMEWNRASTLNNLPNRYLLTQQAVGVGFNLVTKPTVKVRTGVSENFFDTWNSVPMPSHSSRVSESAFDEVEWTLPWRMSVTQRGVWYPIAGRPDEWEDKIELSKKLTETLSVSLRQEIRRNSPDTSAQDYTRLRMLVGFDF